MKGARPCFVRGNVGNPVRSITGCVVGTIKTGNETDDVAVLQYQCCSVVAVRAAVRVCERLARSGVDVENTSGSDQQGQPPQGCPHCGFIEKWMSPSCRHFKMSLCIYLMEVAVAVDSPAPQFLSSIVGGECHAMHSNRSTTTSCLAIRAYNATQHSAARYNVI